jgi:uncharacterized protein (UPF0276 family)
MRASTADRVGLAWRDEMAAAIHLNLDAIEHVEVIAEREFRAPRSRIAALAELARVVPLSLHGVGLGLASSAPPDERRLARLARLIEQVAPDHWSEHLAFVRAGGFEIGHLAAAPYNSATLAGTFANLERARQVIGSLPHLENIATLLQPPGSCWSEVEFVGHVMRGSGCPLLLDLHNLHANAWNFRRDPFADLLALPLQRVATVHVSGGRLECDRAGVARLVDDHLHDPPDIVFELLAALAAAVPQHLTVIIERDGRYPDFTRIMEQMERARAALKQGRSRAVERLCGAAPQGTAPGPTQRPTPRPTQRPTPPAVWKDDQDTQLAHGPTAAGARPA